MSDFKAPLVKAMLLAKKHAHEQYAELLIGLGESDLYAEEQMKTIIERAYIQGWIDSQANTRKAVREALEKVKRIAEEDVYTAEQHLAANRAGMVIYKMKGYRAAFDQLLTQYQEPRP